MVVDEFRFNFRGRKYTLYLDDGYVHTIRLPGGRLIYDLPPELAADSRLQRFLHRQQELVRDARVYLDEEYCRAWRDVVRDDE